MRKKAVLLFMSLLILTASFVGCSSKKPKDGQLEIVCSELKKLYGSNYIPTERLDEEYLSEIYGVDTASVKDFIIEASATSMHIDTFIGIEAADGKASEIETKLLEYRQSLIDDTMQYPINVFKIEASTVLRVDNYVFFLILGGYDDELTDDNEILDFYKAQTQKGVDRIKELLSN